MIRDSEKSKINQTVMQPLVIHRSLFDEIQKGAETLTPELSKIFQRCLTVAGGYDGKTIVLGINEDGPDMVHTFMHHDAEDDLRIKNPMYVESSQLTMLLGDVLSDAEDPVFPHSQKHLNWGQVQPPGRAAKDHDVRRVSSGCGAKAHFQGCDVRRYRRTHQGAR